MCERESVCERERERERVRERERDSEARNLPRLGITWYFIPPEGDRGAADAEGE